jgi:hypothetical protein
LTFAICLRGLLQAARRAWVRRTGSSAPASPGPALVAAANLICIKSDGQIFAP